MPLRPCLAGCGSNGRSERQTSYCDDCHEKANYAKHREWSARHPEQHARLRWNANLKHNYGITVDDYERLLAGQDGVCAVCRTHGTKHRLHVDHDHETGRVRALLCSNCNTALGKLRESPDLIRALLRYAEDACGKCSDLGE